MDDIIDLKFGDIKDEIPLEIINELKEKCFIKINSYPKNYDSLIEKLAQKHATQKNNIILVNGVDEGIELIARVFGQNTLIFPPTYYEFFDAPRRNNLNYTQINSFKNNEYKIQYKDEDILDRSLIYLCNPNNPFGILSKQEILEIAGKTKGIVAVDETYIDFNGETVIGELKNYENILVLRSFSKGYSVAGLRIGYMIGSEKLLSKIENVKLYFNVSSVSVEMAKVLLDHQDYFSDLISNIKVRKEKFENFLKDKGLNLIQTMTNNIIIKFPSEQEANQFNLYLRENNIIINQGNGLSTCGLDDSFIRFACGTESQMKQVTEVVDQYKF